MGSAVSRELCCSDSDLLPVQHRTHNGHTTDTQRTQKRHENRKTGGDLRFVNMVKFSGSACKSQYARLMSVSREKRFSKTSGGKYVAPVNERSRARVVALPQMRRRYASVASRPCITIAAGGWIHLQVKR